MDNSVERGKLEYIDGGVDCKICIIVAGVSYKIVGCRKIEGVWVRVKAIDLYIPKSLHIAQIDTKVLKAIKELRDAIAENISGVYSEPQGGIERALFVLETKIN
jgi:hypothetical protein